MCDLELGLIDCYRFGASFNNRIPMRFQKRVHVDACACSDCENITAFADRLEQASLDTIRSGVMTGDLAGLVEGDRPTPVTSEAFLKAIRARMEM